jgi:DNA-binding Lrp family transcriptional regulator
MLESEHPSEPTCDLLPNRSPKRGQRLTKITENTISRIAYHRDQGKSYKKITDERPLSEVTVRIRVNELVRKGILAICGRVNPQAMPDMQPMIMGVKRETTDLFKKGKEVSRLKDVVTVNGVTGRYD